MPGTYLNYPFDEDIFIRRWAEEPDPVKTALLTSGVMVADDLIAGQLTEDGNLFTIPFYNVLSGDPVNYDGATDITANETTASYQTGIAYGRAKGFTARDFVGDLTGADPMGHIVSTVGKYWNKYRQNKILIGILEGVFGITSDTPWEAHTVETEAAPTATLLSDVATAVLGDNRGLFAAAVMHSHVAHQFEKLELLEYWKYTDAAGVQRPLNIASLNGYTVVIDDGVPVSGEGASAKYTTYLLGMGALRYAQARVRVPVETHRDPMKNGGQDTLITRIREVVHPNGFSFDTTALSGNPSPTDEQLKTSTNWKRAFNAKAIPLAKIVTTG